MRLYPALIWAFTTLAFVFLFVSLRTAADQLLYSIIALGFWGLAFFIQKYKPSNEDNE